MMPVSVLMLWSRPTNGVRVTDPGGNAVLRRDSTDCFTMQTSAGVSVP